jgi:hypothetical protein
MDKFVCDIFYKKGYESSPLPCFFSLTTIIRLETLTGIIEHEVPNKRCTQSDITKQNAYKP